jgi:FkbH-like protein
MVMSAVSLREKLTEGKRLAEGKDWAAAHALLVSLLSPEDEFVIQARVAKQDAALPLAAIGLKPLRIAILATSTVDHFADVLRYWLAREGWAAEIWIAPFDTLAATALDASSALYSFAPDFVWLFTSGRDVRMAAADDGAVDAAVAAAVRHSQDLWEAIRSRLPCIILQNNADVPAVDCLGNFAAQAGASRRNLLRRYNLALAQAAPSGVVLFDIEHLSALWGKQRWSDPRYWYHSKHAFAPDAYGFVAFQAARVLAAAKGKARKCMVLDLDNTLWGGVIGDDGLAGIKLGAGTDGDAFVDFQRWLRLHKERGVILVVCSKNEEATAKEPFLAHPDCVLRLEDFAVFRANWDNKADNIRQIAGVLNIGLDSLVFIDDNPLERDLVRTHLPEVAVPDLPEDPTGYIEAIDRHRYFETISLSAEDRERARFYCENAARAELMGRVTNIEDYLRSLAMVSERDDLDPFHLPRMAQLINKSNQFHLTGTRYSEADLQTLASLPGHCVRYFKLKDRIGDNGLIAVVVLVPGADADLMIDTWVMSCRVLGRTMEEFICADMLETARKLGCTTLSGRYVPSPKNQLVAGLYQRLGFHRIGDADGTTTWRLSEGDQAAVPPTCVSASPPLRPATTGPAC